MVAQVATDTSLDRTFDYLVPEALAQTLLPGMRVRVSFGRRLIEGTVVALAESSAFPELKPLLGIVGEHPFLTPELLDLARWMASYYLAPIGQVLGALLPAPVRRPGGAPARERLVVELIKKKKRNKQKTTLSPRKKQEHD